MNHLGWSTSQYLLRLFPMVITISFAMDVFVPAIPEMELFFRSTPSIMQASLYLFMFTVALGQLLIGPLADRFGRKALAQITGLFFLIGSVVASYAQNISILLTARVIQAIGACGTYLLCFIIVRDNFSTKDCAKLYCLLTGINSITASLAPVIGGMLLDLTHNWRSGFYFLSVLGVIICLSIFIAIPNYKPKSLVASSNYFSEYKIIFKDRNFRIYAFVSASALLGLYLFCALSSEILIAKHHVTGTTYGLLFGLNALTVFSSNLLAARLTKTISLPRLIKTGLMITFVASLSMILANLSDSSVWRFMIPMLCMTTGIGLSLGCSTAQALKNLEQYSAKATSLISAFQFFISGLIGILITLLPMNPFSLAGPVFIFTLYSLALSRSGKRLKNIF